MRPFEIVDERPGEISAEVDALLYRRDLRAHMRVEIGDAPRIVGALDFRHAVLGDVDRLLGVIA